jgi:hypothetical protein
LPGHGAESSHHRGAEKGRHDQRRATTVGNTRFGRRLFEAAVVRRAWRLLVVPDPTVEQLCGLSPEDLAIDEEVLDAQL